MGGGVVKYSHMFDKPVDIAKTYGSTNLATPKKKQDPVDVKPKRVFKSSATYKEYLALRKTPEFKLWWKKQYASQHAQCYYCHVSFINKRVNVEHMIPMSRGGTNAYSNLVLSCAKCNKEKGSSLLKSGVVAKLGKRHKKRVRRDAAKYYKAKEAEEIYQSNLGAFYRNNF